MAFFYFIFPRTTIQLQKDISQTEVKRLTVCVGQTLSHCYEDCEDIVGLAFYLLKFEN